jgi:hypothetical protein
VTIYLFIQLLILIICVFILKLFQIGSKPNIRGSSALRTNPDQHLSIGFVCKIGVVSAAETLQQLWLVHTHTHCFTLILRGRENERF